jgi:hypothetical protein
MTTPAPKPAAGRARGTAVRVGVVALAVGVLYLLRPGVLENSARSPRAWLLVAAIVVATRLASVVVTRLTGRSRAGTVASAVVVAIAVVVLIGPSFSQRTLDEPLPASAPAGAQAPAGAEAAPAADPPAVGDGAGDAVTPTEVSSGRLEGVGHSASGRTSLVDVGGRLALRFEDVDIEGAPGPYVHLVPPGGRTPEDGIGLGALKAERGSFNYVLPADVDAGQDWTVLVWCRPFATPIAASDHARV